MKTSPISFDPATNSITFLDNNIGGAATVRTDAVIEDLVFVFKDRNRADGQPRPTSMYVETQITVRTRTIQPRDRATGNPLADAGSAFARTQLLKRRP